MGTNAIASRTVPPVQKGDSAISSIHRDRLEFILSNTAKPEGGAHAILFGPRGTGKTTAAVAAAMPGQRVISITLNSEGSAASIWGHFVPKGGEFVWNNGPAAQAWNEGALLVINELDHASEDVSNILHVLLDNPAVAQITLPTGETVSPKPGFRCIASMNGRLDDVAQPVLDRFSEKIPVLGPSKAMLKKLAPDTRYACEYLYKEVEQAEAGQDWEPKFTYRQLLDFDQLRETPGLETREAAELVTGSRAGGESLIDVTARFANLTSGMERALA